MRGRSSIRLPSGDIVWLVPWHAVESAVSLDRAREWARAALDAGGSTGLRSMIAAYSDLDDAALVETIAARIAGGDLVVVRLDDDTLAHGSPSAAPRPAELRQVPLLSDMLPRARTHVDLELVTDRGTPLSEITVDIVLPDGTSNVARTRADGRAVLDPIDAGGTCEVRLDAGQLRRPASDIEAPKRARVADARISAWTPGVVRVQTGGRRVVVVDWDAEVPYEDVTFGNERAVLLPTPPFDHRPFDPQRTSRGLAAIASLLQFAATHPDHPLWISGHSDAFGSTTADLSISAARAENVAAFLGEGPAAWAEHTMSVYAVEDLQVALAWVASRFAWDTTPGAIDNELGPITKSALVRLRQRFAIERGTQPVGGDVVLPEDWRMIGELYDLALADALHAEPAAARRGLRWLEPRTTACGREHPRRLPAPTGTEGTDRRSEIVFVPPAVARRVDEPSLRDLFHRGDAFERMWLPECRVPDHPSPDLTPIPATVLCDRHIVLPNPCVKLELPATTIDAARVTVQGRPVDADDISVQKNRIYFEVLPIHDGVEGEVRYSADGAEIVRRFRLEACDGIDEALDSLTRQFRNLDELVETAASDDPGLLRHAARERQISVLCDLERAELSREEYRRFIERSSALELTARGT